MRYIVKNNKIYGIADTNYSDLSSHPSINGVPIAEAKNYTSGDLSIFETCTKAEYDALETKNPNTYYLVIDDTATSGERSYLDLANKPSINGVVLTGNKPLESIGVYSIDEIDALLSATSRTRVIEFLQSNLFAFSCDADNSIYIYLPANPTRIAYKVDTTLNKITSEARCTIEVTGQTQISISDSSDTTNVPDGTYTLDALGGTQNTEYTLSNNTLYYVGTTVPYSLYLVDMNGTVTLLGDTNTDMSNYYTASESNAKYQLLANKVTEVTSSSTDTEYPSAKALYDFAIEREKCIAKGIYIGNSTSVDDCIFSFDDDLCSFTANTQKVYTKLFPFAHLVDPISGATIEGRCTTTMSLFHNGNNSAMNIYIEQSFVRSQLSNKTQRIEFWRKGYVQLSNSALTDLSDMTGVLSSTLTWGVWVPIEYPYLNLSSYFDTSVATVGTAAFHVTGGVATISLGGIIILSAGTGTSQVIATLPSGIYSATKASASSGKYYDSFAVTLNSKIALLQFQGSNGQLQIFSALEANSKLWGSIVVPMGY